MLWSDEPTFQMAFRNHGCPVLCVKEEKDHPDCHHHRVQKSASVMEWCCVGTHGMGSLHIFVGIIMLRGTYRCWSNTCCHPDDSIFRDVPVYSTKTMTSHILQLLQKCKLLHSVVIYILNSNLPNLFGIV